MVGTKVFSLQYGEGIVIHESKGFVTIQYRDCGDEYQTEPINKVLKMVRKEGWKAFLFWSKNFFYFFLKKVLTNKMPCDIIIHVRKQKHHKHTKEETEMTLTRKELEDLALLLEETNNKLYQKLIAAGAVKYLRERGFTVIHKDINLYELR